VVVGDVAERASREEGIELRKFASSENVVLRELSFKDALL
jgi:hypothetical protein